jgi:hypothetical protein
MVIARLFLTTDLFGNKGIERGGIRNQQDPIEAAAAVFRKSQRLHCTEKTHLLTGTAPETTNLPAKFPPTAPSSSGMLWAAACLGPWRPIATANIAIADSARSFFLRKFPTTARRAGKAAPASVPVGP